MSTALLRWRAKRDIDLAAGEARLRFISDLPGQPLVYDAKLGQAQAFVAALTLDPAALVPSYIAAEAAATNRTPADVAQAVLAQAAAWDAAGPAIEGIRMGAKAAVSAAEEVGGIDSARNAAVAALAAIVTT